MTSWCFSNSSTGQSQNIGTPAHYTALRLAPDGGTLAALVTPTGPKQGSTLDLFATTGGGAQSISLPPAAESTYLDWSPDGSRLAVLGTEIYVVSQSGVPLGDAAAPQAANSTGGYTVSSGGYAWAPNSRHFATIENGSLVILAQDGAAQVTSLTSILPASAVNSDSIVSLVGWTGDSTLSLASFPAGTPAWTVSVAGAEPVLTSTSATPAAIEAPGPQLGSSLSSELSGLIGGGSPSLMWSHPTADGAGDLYAVRSSSGTDPPLVIALTYQLTTAVVQLPISPKATFDGWLDGWLIDAVAQNR